MKINPKLRQDLIKYNLNFPTDARTKEYKSEVEKYKAPELYKLFLQSKVATEKIKQRDIERKEKKEANKKARAEAKLRKRYVGSVTIKIRYTDIKKFSIIKVKTLPIDIIVNPSNLKAQIKNIIDDYINEQMDNTLGYSINGNKIMDIRYLSHTENIKIVDNKPTPLNKTRMREAGVGIYDGYDTQEWNTNTGRCVFDYIINRYGDIKGFIKICTYESLNRIFNRHREVPLNLLDIGVNTEEIRNFCVLHNIPMYAVDENENTFCQYIPDNRNKKCPALIYRISNSHFYPINDNTKIKSIIKSTSIINNINSDIIDNSYKKKNDETDDIKEDMSKVVFVDDINKKLLSKLEDNKIPTKIVMKNKDLTAFSYEGYKYIQNDNIEVIKKLCDNMKVKYIGQGITTLLETIYKEAIGNDKLPKSTHNPFVFNSLLIARKARSRCGAVIENYNSVKHIKDLTAWDIVKCYTSCMYEASEDWIRLDYNDTWQDYDGELKLGLYYVATSDTTLFKKSGYYSTCIIKKAISEGIDFIITKQLIATHKEDKNIFTKIIDVIMKYSNEDTNISKSVINLMSGLLGQSDKTISKGVHINNDINQIFNFLNKYYHLENGIMINKIENTNYFMYGFNQKVIFNESNMPMYIQILDESNIKLYDMIKKMGGQLVAYKVDCVVASGVNIECPNDTKWGGYRSCEVPNISNIEIINNVEFREDGEWEDYNFNDSDEWESIMKVMIDNKGLLLQASAGNGKTYTAKMIASKLGDRVKIIAPTNKAALNIGGSTIHRFLQINEQGYIKANKLKKIKEDYDYIIVDEISMISKDLWRRLCLLKQEAPNIIFLLLGDEKQCPPVEDEVMIEDYFNHPSVKYICNYNRNVLNVRKRYDETLYNLLEDVNAINIKKYPKLITERNICYYNKTRIRVNKMWNDKKKKNGDLFIPALIDNDPRKLTQDMYVYNGLPLIAMKTKHDGDDLLFANSETFIICKIGDDYISMYNERPDDNGNKSVYMYKCPIEDFNKYFLMNYCSTTHKSQGETIMENYTIYDWNAMDTKIRYTALSRARKIEQVCFN
jgi:hypothetical protein